MLVPRFHAYPLQLQPVYKRYLWGGDRIATRFHRTVPVSPCAESWEVADRDDGMSVILNQTYRGMTLHDLLRLHGQAVTGTRHGAEHFPLLIKLIDARQDLSVQVHLNEATAAHSGGEPKTEMWLMLDCEPKARLYAGMQPGMTPERMRQALAQGRMDPDVLIAVPARKGQVVFMPGGRVHAIGAGCLLLEVQQNSNTTYRIYDWDRTGPDGDPRELHLEQALSVIDWEHGEPDVRLPATVSAHPGQDWQTLLECPWFTMRRRQVAVPLDLPPAPETFRVLFVETGRVMVHGGGERVMLAAGATCLLPAALEDPRIEPLDGAATVIRIEA